MLTSLSKLVNNLFEIYSKKCRDKNCKSECEFITNLSAVSVKKKQLKPINGLISFQIHTNFVMETLINLFCY